MRRQIAIRWACAVVGSGIMFAGAAIDAQPGPAVTQAPVWVAVAFAPSTGNYGASTPQSSSDAASQMALKYCAMYGAKDCRVLLSAWNECLALATSIKPASIACCWGKGGDNREAAATLAMNSCKANGLDCAVRISPCYTDDPRWASPLPLPTAGFQPGSVDPDLVGYWKANVSGGLWILQIAANGTYTFHSAAPASPGNEPMHNGTFTASNGRYTLHAISMVLDDQGTYAIEGASKGTLQMTAKLWSGTWYRTGVDPDP